MSTKKKTTKTTVLVDQDTLHSFIEGGLWSMRLLKEHETVTGVQLIDNQYEVEINGDTKQMELPW